MYLTVLETESALRSLPQFQTGAVVVYTETALLVDCGSGMRYRGQPDGRVAATVRADVEKTGEIADVRRYRTVMVAIVTTPPSDNSKSQYDRRGSLLTCGERVCD